MGSLTSDLAINPQISNDSDGAVGLDAKYGLTQNLTADFTYNTDFAQVEADEQQINLTRFSLFFPEKREFFLENQGLFAFGGVSAANAVRRYADPLLQPADRARAGARRADSRRAAALTGRVGRFSLGVLNIQSKEDPISGSPRHELHRCAGEAGRPPASSIGVI